MEHHQGLESIFYIKYDGFWCPISCEISSPMTEDTEMLNTTTRDNAGWKTERPIGQSYSFSIDAVVTKDNYNDIVSHRKIRKFKRDRTKIEWKRETIENYLIETGFGYIPNVSDVNTVGEELTFNFTISGFGKPIENEIPDIYSIYSDDIIYNFNYEHTPVDTVNEGEWYLVNRLYNNYYNAYGINYDCNLKTQIKSVPVKGFLANNTTREVYTIDSIISYCDKDELVYFPNGFDNDLGVTGNFTESFTYRIIDANGKVGKLTTHTINMTDIAAPSIDISVSISWFDDTSAPKTGNNGNVIVKLVSLVSDPLDPIVSQEWQTFDGTNWNFYKTKTTDNETFDLTLIENKIRLKVVSQFGEIVHSNSLIYTKALNSNIYITDIIMVNGLTTYKLHVENDMFIGFAMVAGQKNNTKNSFVKDDYAGRVNIPNSSNIIVFSSQAISLPVGIYDISLIAGGIRNISSITGEINGEIRYSFSNDDFYSPSNPSAHVELIIEAD